MHTLKTLGLIVCLCFGCVQGENVPSCLSAEQVPRANIISRVLRADNHLFLSRQPELVAHKLKKLVADPYDFMRGTAPLWYYDVENIGTARPSVLLTSTLGSLTTLLIGDPHPENLSTAFASGTTLLEPIPTLALEWIDLDGITSGAFYLDLRRALQGVVLFIGGTSECHNTCITSLATSLATSYRDTLASVEGGNPTTAPPLGVIWSKLVAEAFRDGSARKRFRDHTRETSTHLALNFDDVLNDKDKGLLRLNAREEAQVNRLFAALKARDHSLVLHDVGRRYGQGVSSVPAIRYILLVESDRTPEPILLNVREIFEPAPIQTWTNGEQIGPRSNGDRLSLGIERIWSWAGADPFAESLQVDGRTFKVLTWSSYFQSLDHESIQANVRDNRFTQNDLNIFAAYVGYTIAQAHARGGSFRGDSDEDKLYDSVQSDLPQLIQYLVDTAARDAARAQSDRDILACLVEAYGPLAGLYDQMEKSP